MSSSSSKQMDSVKNNKEDYECFGGGDNDKKISALAVSKKRTTTTTTTTAVTVNGSSSTAAASTCEGGGVAMQRVTPHMERLLRLLHDGDEQAAAAAAAQLTRLTEQSSAVVLWEILGRLCHTLLRRNNNENTSNNSSSSSSWKSRRNAAMAMQGVARHLPVMDQRDFMSQKVTNAVGSSSNSKITATTTTTTSAEGIATTSGTQKSTANSNIDTTTMNESTPRVPEDDEEKEKGSAPLYYSYQHQQLQLSALEAHIDRVLSQGRHLYATAATRYDAQQEEYEDLSVENLTTSRQQQQQQQHNEGGDGTFENGNNNNDDYYNNNIDFVQQRTRLQRQILAQRLGLGAISRAMGGASSSLCDSLLPEGIVSEVAMQSLDCMKTTAVAVAASKQETEDACTNHQPLRKKRRHLLYSGTADAVDSGEAVIGDIRALLVTEMELEHNKASSSSVAATASNPSAGGGCSGDASAPSHRNPQQLLASELIYRMFDSAWQVRHGALLGTLAILQAWRKAAATSTLDTHVDDDDNDTGDYENDSSIETTTNHKVVAFGSWPEDILVRCLCILSLDRFGDFSGTTATMSSTVTATTTTTTANTQTERSPQGGVVAPVRDTAAQLLSVLWTMAPLDMQKRTLEILYRLAKYSGGEWEVRHGALVALKFVTVVIVEGTAMQESQMTNRTWYQECLGNILRATIGHLHDESDDVVSVAAQTLFEIVRGQVAPDSSSQERRASSIVGCNAGEIVKPLWSAMRTAKPYSSSIVDLVALFPVLLKMDSAAVLYAIGESNEKCGIGEIVSLLWEFLGSEFESVQVAALKSMGMLSEQLATMAADTASKEAYILILDRLFSMHFIVLPEEKNQTTDKTLDSLGSQLGLTWMRICDISGLLFGEKDDIARKLEVKLLTRYFGCVETNTMSTTDSFERLLQACDALVYFLSSRGLSNASSALIDMCLCSFISSPWLSLCEAACLLYRGLRTRQGDHPALVKCYQSILACLFQTTPLCIETGASDKGLDALRDASVIKVCNDAFLEGVRMVDGGATPDEASHFTTELWKGTFRSRGITMQGGTERLVDMQSMRLRATMAHAVVAGGLPSKITPLVRSLVTSLKSEVCVARQLQTCTSIASLLCCLDGEVKYASAYSKIIGNVCDMATEEAPTAGKYQPATQVLHIYVRSMTNSMLHDEMNPLLSRLARISPDDLQSNDLDVVYAVNLLQAVSSGLVKGNVSCSYFVDKYTSPLSLLSCRHMDENVRRTSLSAVKYLCHTDPTCGLRHALSTTVQQLKECGSRMIRSECFRLLKAIIEEAGMDLCPFIRSLLPLVMTLMTDSDQENAKMANNMFAYLVRLAPLIRFHQPLFEEEIADNHSESVIDHLILGKPLPLCNVPIHILDELRYAGVSLRGYQKEGISWLRFLQTVNLNGALCDAMGLGKTLMALVGMAIAHSNQPADSRPVSLVVCPSTLVGHWVAEIERFFPSGDVIRPLGLVHSRDVERQLSNGEPRSSWNVIVTSYALMRNNIERFGHQDWTYCILDEGHLLKNPKTATARASRRLRGQHKLILTGTPVQNSVTDLWATFDFLMPNFLGSSAFFSKHYAGPITKSQLPGANASSISVGMEKLKILHQQVLPFILRREKEQVLKELPPKNIMDISCRLSEQQARIYQAFLSGSEAKKSIAALNRYLADVGAVESKSSQESLSLGAEVLKSLLFLRLLCTHPVLVQQGCQLSESSDSQSVLLSASGKLEALSELLRDSGICTDTLTAADNDTSLLYCADDSDQEESADTFIEYAELAPLSATSGSGSGVGPRSKCLIFAQFSQSLDVLETLLFKPHMPSLRYLRLDGRVAAEKRTLIVDRFNRDPSIAVLLLTTRVGSLGLNLTGADTVVFMEHDYNPFADLQAMDRAHRLGQKSIVNVYRLIMKDTIEEKIMELQRKKVAVSNAIVNSDNSSMYSMGTDRLLDIFTFRSDQEGTGKGKEESGYDLDALMERYGEDYATLSVDEFVRNFRNLTD